MNTQCQLTPVPYQQVRFEDAFWAPRLETNRRVTIPRAYRQLEAAGRFSAFDLNFKRPVPTPIVHIFGDSDAAKWLEAACYSLCTHPDPDLEKLVGQVAGKIIYAQQPDGYLNTHFTVVQPEMRWRNLRDWHELYCAGHLMEAAVAHYQATGSRNLLDALCRYADHIGSVFGRGPGQKRGYCGHPEIELALIRLYHATKEPRYLQLASYFVDERGTQPHYYDLEARQRGEDPDQFWAKNYQYSQSHVPVRQQAKVVGHAVRAMYLLSAMADLAQENDDATLLETCQRLWDNLAGKRLYLTGGIGPSRHNEGFTEDFDLPDESAYAETCATIGLILWNHRLLQFSGESKYADILERGLYNGFLSGVSLDGERFFYDNPLASTGKHHRQGWFSCPCCPTNLIRILASLGQFFYSTSEKGIWVHLFAEGAVDLRLDGQDICLRQATGYPWDGKVKFTVEMARPQAFAMHVRVPGWCEGWQLMVNGKPVQGLRAQANGYLAIDREWSAGDTINYTMDMPVQVVWAHPAVRYLQGRMAIQRGPIVYCLEGADHGGIALDRIALDPRRVLSEVEVVQDDGLLGGVTLLHSRGMLVDQDGWEGGLYSHQPPSLVEQQVTAIPYYAWDHRSPGEMRVWVRATH